MWIIQRDIKEILRFESPVTKQCFEYIVLRKKNLKKNVPVMELLEN